MTGCIHSWFKPTAEVRLQLLFPGNGYQMCSGCDWNEQRLLVLVLWLGHWWPSGHSCCVVLGFQEKIIMDYAKNWMSWSSVPYPKYLKWFIFSSSPTQWKIKLKMYETKQSITSVENYQKHSKHRKQIFPINYLRIISSLLSQLFRVGQTNTSAPKCMNWMAHTFSVSQTVSVIGVVLSRKGLGWTREY